MRRARDNIGIFGGIKSVIGFLTIFPIGISLNSLSQAAKHMYFFPLIGAFIGFFAGGIGWLSLHILPPLVTGMLTLGFIILLSGFHHLDGLLDFGDGVMVRGPPSKKIKAMRDQKVGTGGIALALITLLITAFGIADLGALYIIPALIVAEASAKFSMVIVAAAGRSACKGMNTYFIDAMHDDLGGYRFLAALIVLLGLALVLLRAIGVAAVIAAIVLGLVMTAIANGHFGGVTGDVFGATNEIARMGCILVILAMI